MKTNRVMIINRFFLIATAVCLFTLASCKNNDSTEPSESIVQFVYTSDSHFGITRDMFRGEAGVSSDKVNQAMVAQINTKLLSTKLPADGGVRAAELVEGVDFVITTGDMANRAEQGIALSAQTWLQFKSTYIDGLTVKNFEGQKAPLFISPGNHDISNATGHQKIPVDNVDATAMAEIYNYVYTPSVKKTKETYNFYTDKINFTKTVKGINLVFTTIWPDTRSREWMSNAIQNMTSPVLIFAHDQPDIESKHLLDPASDASKNNYVFNGNNFENLVNDAAPAGSKASSYQTDVEQNALSAFLKANTKIKAYFHGNSNWNEFYTFAGLPIFRVDSPMKGETSGKDPKKLSFQLVTIDTRTMQMTVRECLWNSTDSNSDALVWGETKTVSIK